MNNKGQASIVNPIIAIIGGLIGLLIFVVLFTGFFPTFQDSFDGLRDQSVLNCESSVDVCGGIGSNSTCYNATEGNTHGISCSVVGLSLPLILIGLLLVILGGFAVTRI